MEYHVSKTTEELGVAAAETAGAIIRNAIEERGRANIVLATGMSQVNTLSNLVERDDIDWQAVTAFHLDEYIGLSESHAASFRKYLKERFLAHVPHLGEFHFVDGEAADPQQECRRVGNIISQHRIDVALVGIGENAHLAFNDPPADFDVSDPFIVVELDQACRQQQVNEGWFDSLDDVPSRAISMTISQIMRSENIVASVPDKRKAEGVKCSVEGAVSKMCPASILQQHLSCELFLDNASASLLGQTGK